MTQLDEGALELAYNQLVRDLQDAVGRRTLLDPVAAGTLVATSGTIDELVGAVTAIRPYDGLDRTDLVALVTYALLNGPGHGGR